MKIFTQGARHFGSQLPRIDKGFVALGHELVQTIDSADLVYSNNLWSDQIIADKIAGRFNGKYIQNVLDLAPHLGAQFPLEKLKSQLSYADAITTISSFVQKDLKNRGGYDSTVIYNPIKNITRTTERKHPYRFLFVGRVNDPAKRCGIAAAALQILGMRPDEVVTVGDQPPHFGGTYWGVATDSVLNELYNSVDFVMFPSYSEGLGLPMIEAMSAGAIPLVCNDLTTREEFLPSFIFPEYSQVEPNPRSIAGFIARTIQREGAMEELKERLYSHYVAFWQDRTSRVGVARKILEVYEGIK